MQRGWSAKGLLQPLWSTYPGGRDALAVRVGTNGATLSSLNTGRRNLGPKLGQRLADALGISLLELGAPGEEAEPRSRTLLLRLEELEGRHDELREIVLHLMDTLDLRITAASAQASTTSQRNPRKRDQDK